MGFRRPIYGTCVERQAEPLVDFLSPSFAHLPSFALYGLKDSRRDTGPFNDLR